MVEFTSKYLTEKLGIKKTDKLLLAISGGIDSMVMLDIFCKMEYEIAVAHCNFQLRGKESDGDELLVKSTCKRKNIPFFSIQFETNQFAEENNISIQMAARDLRYNWFEELQLNHGFNYIAVAHNANDVVETFFINLSRGTGIKGLSGIKAKTSNIVRPLLPFSRDEIEAYSKENHIQFREDASNASDKYHRNRIRHNIIPEFQKINPSFLPTMLENIERLQELSVMLNSEMETKKLMLIEKKEDKTFINIGQLKKEKTPLLVLFEVLNEYGFNASQIEDIIDSLDNQPGQEFLSPSHRLIKDREELILIKDGGRTILDDMEFEIGEGIPKIVEPIFLELEYFDLPNNFKPSRDENIAELDAGKVAFPLKLRKWKLGDYFYPLGMKNRKKLSDFFVDNKFSIIDKENAWILADSNNHVIWIIGHRIDDRCKVTDETRKIIKIIYR